MQTRSQKYAAVIFRQVKGLADEGDQRMKDPGRDDAKARVENERRQYGATAHKLPVLIRTAGLAQALGFVEARGSDAAKRLLRDLGETLGRPSLPADSRAAELPEYIHLTRQCLDALLWYKRFAQSVLQVEGGEEGD